MEAIQELSERKTKILHAIIKNYLETGEPVGSRTISKYTDLNLSSATIRNEMADLEMLGYLEQLHTSSGRIPSSKGYRFYVDGLIPPKPVSDEEKELINRWYRARVKRIDEGISAAKACINLAPEYADGYLLLGLLQREKGLKQESIENLKKAQELGDTRAEEYLKQ